MASSTISPHTGGTLGDREMWKSLQQAIAASSGFQRWQQAQIAYQSIEQGTLEEQIRRYLRQTLETLAY